MRNFIVGTDWWTDCDDAVAVRLLARAHNDEEINLLGFCINATMEYSASSLDAFLISENNFFPIGVDFGATKYQGKPKYQKRLAELPSTIYSNKDCINGVELYRMLLSGAEDNSVEIIELGYQQVLKDLLKSKPDNYSNLSGRELVKKKVKRLWAMAGRWDIDGAKENNVSGNLKASIAASYVCKHWCTPITFLGYEVGKDVITGGNLPSDDILAIILKDYGTPNGRDSWDPMLALLAVYGDYEYAGYDIVKGTAKIDMFTGKNHFVPSEDGNHCYVIKNQPDKFYIDDINSRII